MGQARSLAKGIPSRATRCRESVSLRPAHVNAAARSAVAGEAPAALAFAESQQLLRACLNASVLRSFTRLTGSGLHVVWHEAPHSDGDAGRAVICPNALRKARARGDLAAGCRTCLETRWESALGAGVRGRRVRGQCGLITFCATLAVGSHPFVSLLVQTRGRRPVAATAASLKPSCQKGKKVPPQQRANQAAGAFDPREEPWAPQSVCLTKPLTTLPKAVALLRLVAHDFQETLLALRTRKDLDLARARLQHITAEDARLRQALRQRVPDLSGPLTNEQPAARAQQIAQFTLDYLRQNYHRQIRLTDAASALKMNPTYLSSLFSHTVGISFHHCLEEFRLAKAKELLRDPRNRVREVAAAVGFASEGSFRHVFKDRAGLAPSAWRQAL